MSATTKFYHTLFLTDRSLHHQQAAQEAAPPELEITFLRRPSSTELLAHLPETEILITERSGVIDGTLIEAAPKLQLIQRLGSLTHDIDLAAAQARDIPVCRWPIKSCIMVAEHMLMQMLALVKRLAEVSAVAIKAEDWGRPSLRTDENTFAYNWSRREAIAGIYQRTVGILGFGEIGAELARRLRPLQPAQVFYHRRHRLPATVEEELGITYAEPKVMIPQVDFLCSLLPYSEETDYSLNGATFQQMQQGSFVISCGSGSVIDEAALADALERRHLAGAALDTYEWEPLRAENPLLPLARQPTLNVLLTPHTAAGVATDPAESLRLAEYSNIRRWLAGEPLLYRC